MGRDLIEDKNLKLQMTSPTNIKTDCVTCPAVIKILNVALADEAVLGLKTRGAHWNVHGPGFFDRRTLFDAQCRQLNDISDEISKRTLVLNGRPIGSFGEFLQNARLDERPGVIPDIFDLMSDHEALIDFLREDAQKCVDEYDDQTTRDLLIGFLNLHEKMAWLLRSNIKPELPGQEKPISLI